VTFTKLESKLFANFQAWEPKAAVYSSL